MSDTDTPENLDISFYQLTEQYPDEASAVLYFESARWPDGTECLTCESKEVTRIKTARNRPIWQCTKCGDQFSVTIGTIMEDTKLPLRKWLFAFHFMGASKKGMSALQVSRMLSISYRTAWHLCHRIRMAMASVSESEDKMSGIIGTHHHTSKKHLPRYLTEYDYKYNTREMDDGERVRKAISGIVGKRLTLFKAKSFRAPSLIDENTPESRGRKKRGPKNKKKAASTPTEKPNASSK